MKSIRRWFKQAFCFHDFDEVFHKDRVAMLKCYKCGKEIKEPKD